MDNDASVTTSLKSLKRKPYHYNATANWTENSTIQNGSQSVPENAPAVSVSAPSSSSSSGSNDHEEPIPNEDYVWSNRALYSRYLYYNQLRRRMIPNSDDILLIPPHVIPTEFFFPQYTRSSDGKQGSVITIFAIWNTMMGTSILAMPFAMERAGIVPGITLLLLMALISFYTAYRILEVFEAHENSVVTDLAVLCKKLLGRFAQITAVIFSALTILGALVVYWVLMSNFLFHTVDFFYSSATSNPTTSFSFMKNGSGDTVYCPTNDNTTSSDDDDTDTDTFHKIWSLHRTVPLFLIAILGPIALVRSPAFFMKFNSLGTVSVVYLLVFVIVKWVNFGVNLNFVDPTSPSYVPLFKASCPALAGMLSLAFFIHNCVVTIMQNNRNQRNNKRDLGLAFFFVALTYFLIGGIFYVIFPLDKGCIEDNFLNNFRSSDLWTFTARIFLFFQMLTVFPLLMYILRVQICYALTKQEPTTTAVYAITFFVISICVMFAIFLPKIGTILRFTGAICGLVYVFCLPICLYLKWMSNRGTLTWTNLLIHLALLALGFVNVVLQFVVKV